MVGQIVAADAVHKHIKAAAMRIEPGDDRIELGAAEGQLAAPARVRADFFFMHAADLHAELLTGRSHQCARLRQRVGIEINMRMVKIMLIDGVTSIHAPIVTSAGQNAAMNTHACPALLRRPSTISSLFDSCLRPLVMGWRPIWLVIVVLTALSTQAAAFDLQGHRGARGLAPENTLPAFERALTLGVSTLELDIGLTADGVVVIAHDPYLNPLITRDAAGQWLPGSKGPLIRSLSFAQLQAYDVGRIQPGTPYASTFSNQQPVDGTRMPTLAALFERVKLLGATGVRFNIETKLNPEQPGDTASPEQMTEALIKVVRDAGMLAQVSIQSFDWRTLQIVQRLEPSIPTVYLSIQTANTNNISSGAWTAGFKIADHASVPAMVKAAGGAVWSPNGGAVTQALVQQGQALGLKVIPWTINQVADMARLIGWGVDGLITDYPDRLREVMRQRQLPLPAPLKN